MTDPEFSTLLATQSDTLDRLQLNAYKSAYDLLCYLNTLSTSLKNPLQLCTSESLTAGLIFSTLVDIPIYGYLKYGCFGVYDTDAKRVLNGVTVDNVYSHLCAEQMAIGILKNTNAGIGLAVTGNAMPTKKHAELIGEVFIGIAAYDTNGNIICKTKVINGCMQSEDDSFKKTCQNWYHLIHEPHIKNYDHRQLISREVRLYTTSSAFDFALDFLKTHTVSIPIAIRTRKENFEKIKSDGLHDCPPNKFLASIQIIHEEQLGGLTKNFRFLEKYYIKNKQ